MFFHRKSYRFLKITLSYLLLVTSSTIHISAGKNPILRKEQKVVADDILMEIFYNRGVNLYDMSKFYRSPAFRDASPDKKRKLAISYFHKHKWKPFKQEVKHIFITNVCKIGGVLFTIFFISLIFRSVSHPIFDWILYKDLTAPKVIASIKREMGNPSFIVKMLLRYLSNYWLSYMYSIKSQEMNGVVCSPEIKEYLTHIKALTKTSFEIKDSTLLGKEIISKDHNTSPAEWIAAKAYFLKDYFDSYSPSLALIITTFLLLGELTIPSGFLSVLPMMTFIILPWQTAVGLSSYQLFKFCKENYVKGIKQPFLIWTGQSDIPDPLEASEKAYISIKHEINERLQASIEKRLIDARRTPTPQAISDTVKFIDTALAIARATRDPFKELGPKSIEEINTYQEQHYTPKEKELFKYYAPSVRKKLSKVIRARITPREDSCLVMFGGTFGVGKTYAAHKVAEVTGGAIAQLSLSGSTPDELIGTETKPGKLIEALVKPGKAVDVLFIDEIDKLLGDKTSTGQELLTKFLSLFDTTKSGFFYSPYLKSHIRLPKIIIMAFNPVDSDMEKNSGWKALNNRVYMHISFKGFSAKTKIEMARELYIPKTCKKLHLEISSLTEKDYAEIENRIHNDKEPGARNVPIIVEDVLLDRNKEDKDPDLDK